MVDTLTRQVNLYQFVYLPSSGISRHKLWESNTAGQIVYSDPRGFFTRAAGPEQLSNIRPVRVKRRARGHHPSECKRRSMERHCHRCLAGVGEVRGDSDEDSGGSAYDEGGANDAAAFQRRVAPPAAPLTGKSLRRGCQRGSPELDTEARTTRTPPSFHRTEGAASFAPVLLGAALSSSTTKSEAVGAAAYLHDVDKYDCVEASGFYPTSTDSDMAHDSGGVSFTSADGTAVLNLHRLASRRGRDCSSRCSYSVRESSASSCSSITLFMGSHASAAHPMKQVVK
jgi:hypothetical protein